MVRPRSFWEQRLRLRTQSGAGGRRSLVQLAAPGFSGTTFGFTGSSYVSGPSAGDLKPGGAVITVTVHLKTTSAPATPDWELIRKGLHTSSGGTDAVPIGARPGSEYFKGALDDTRVQVG